MTKVKKKLTAAQKHARKKAKAERQKKYMWVFMNGGGVVVICEIYQMTITNPFDRPDSLCFQEVFEFVEPDG